ncbi:eukaryotic translation initiation factor 2-alpha kinase 3-like [Ptychodera flava]|uniref:eukaryotic translation initiation factor 2-alpha kinase 3-like n=1 Tax=Ptychodera flava TaxID=63121 RepID=UPI00396A9659
MESGCRTGPLLSSSIDKLMIVNENGRHLRLVPSLDGGLYSWDGDSVEALPFTAESLLKSSFKLSDDSMIVGGKETKTYAISARTGQLRYICSAGGCHTFGEEQKNEDIIMVVRDHQTVRAVEPRTGGEKWNFSVGQHNVRYLKARQDSTNSKYSHTCDDEDGCEVSDYDEYDFYFDDDEDYRVDPNLKFVVSEGIILAFSRQNPGKLVWQKKLPSSIASAWTLKDGEVENVNLFEANNVPALSMDEKEQTNSEVGDYMKPMLYMGMYKKQMYIQGSTKMKQEVREAVGAADENKNGQKLIAGPKVMWRPYIATAPSRTPALITHVVDDEDKGCKTKSCMNQYPFDSGYYLFTDQTPVQLVKDNHRKKDKQNFEGNESIGASDNHWDILLTVSIWEWWKEVLQVSILLSMLADIISRKLKQNAEIQNTRNNDEITPMPSQSPADNQPANTPTNTTSDSVEYKSRYVEDFEQQLCLGKGGFGIVFQAKNKLDDSEYAVKRITLPDREKAREKVLREVKALAKLQHNNIVRYYATWLETPPVGWQEEKDKSLGNGDSTTPFNTYTEYTKDVSLIRESPRLKGKTSSEVIEAQTKPFGGSDNDSEWQNSGVITGASGGFVPMDLEDDEDESGSWSVDYHGNNLHDEVTGSSFGIDFKDDHESSDSSSGDTLNNVPFRNYSKTEKSDSYSVVFEDSGCGDKLSASATESDSNTTANKQETTNSSSLAGVTVDKAQVQSSKGDRTPQNKLCAAERNVKTPIQRAYLYIQMQLCKKETLKDWLLEHTVNRDNQQVLHIFQQIVSAVHYVHELGMIHRDLKPSNIFFSMDGLVKVGDFGLVTAVDIQPATGRTVEDAPERKHTDQVGTQLYMSPEQIAGKEYGHKVDIFTLGLIFFEMMYPFATQSERIQVMMNAKRQEFPQNFVKTNPVQARFAEWLLSSTPRERPNADELVESNWYHDVYRDFKPPPTPRRRNASSCAD